MSSIIKLQWDVTSSRNHSFCFTSYKLIDYIPLKLNWLYDILVNPYLNPFPHTKLLHKMTLKTSIQKHDNKPFPSYRHKIPTPLQQAAFGKHSDKRRNCSKQAKVENIVAKGEIARSEQFFLLSFSFQKAICCRDVGKRLYEGKG